MSSNNFVIKAQIGSANDVGVTFADVLHEPMQVVQDKFALLFGELPDNVLVLFFWDFGHDGLETFEVLSDCGFGFAADWPDGNEVL